MKQDWRDAGASALLTDLYQLKMLDAYRAYDMSATAVFEFFVRKLPDTRSFLMAAGLEQLLDYLEGLSFADCDLAFLRATSAFSDDFVNSLATLRFTGDVDAMPEGTVFFADEPIVRVTAPLCQAQLIETRLINLLQFQTLVASKAARMVLAAGGRELIDFGLRRAHGAEAGLLAARASYLAGFSGTATVLAKAAFGIPIFGTMAHAFIQAHDDEKTAFEHFAQIHPEGLTLLIDTYDTERAALKVVELASRLGQDGISIAAVRIDSGDLCQHAFKVRQILDENGLSGIRIFASGGLDEADLRAFAAAGAPIDGYGMGTRLVTSADAPALDCAYKLVEYDGKPKLKRSEGKQTWPGRKQVYRRFSGTGAMIGDSVALDNAAAAGEALLIPAMRNGQRVGPSPSLSKVRDNAARNLGFLPGALRGPAGGAYPITIDAELVGLAARITA